MSRSPSDHASIHADASESAPTSTTQSSSANETPTSVPLAQAPLHVQLAVDLIYLLEQHQLSPDLVLKALRIVEHDFARKAAAETKSS